MARDLLAYGQQTTTVNKKTPNIILSFKALSDCVLNDRILFVAWASSRILFGVFFIYLLNIYKIRRLVPMYTYLDGIHGNKSSYL